MHPNLANLLLLADRSVFREMGSGLRHRRDHFEVSDLIPWVVVTAVILAILGLLTRWIARREKQAFNNPRALFRELARAHGLDLSSRRLLKQIARATGVRQPVNLFLEPHRFEPTALPKDLQVKWPQIEALRARLFAKGTGVRANGAA